MKKIMPFLFLSLFIIISAPSITGQSMSITTGIGSTHYFDIMKEDHLRSEYGIGESYFLKVNFTDPEASSLFSDIAFKIEKQSGNVNYSTSAIFCGVGFSSNMIFANEHVEKYLLSVISYPIALSISKSIKLKAGFAVNKSFKFRTQSNYENKRNFDSAVFNSNIDNKTFGADAAYEIQFGSFQMANGISIIPVYNAFISLTKEFYGDYNTRSIRQSIGVSILWGLSKK